MHASGYELSVAPRYAPAALQVYAAAFLGSFVLLSLVFALSNPPVGLLAVGGLLLAYAWRHEMMPTRVRVDTTGITIAGVRASWQDVDEVDVDRSKARVWGREPKQDVRLRLGPNRDETHLAFRAGGLTAEQLAWLVDDLRRRIQAGVPEAQRLAHAELDQMASRASGLRQGDPQ